MSHYKIQTGIIPISDGNSGLLLLAETGPERIDSPLPAELIGRISRGLSDENDLVAALEDRFPLEQIYYALILLEKQGVIARNSALGESPADLFRSRIFGQGRNPLPGSPPTVLPVRIVAMGGMESAAEALAASLSRSDVLQVKRPAKWREEETAVDALFVAVTPDYLEPELEAFGRLAHQRELRWLAFKPGGVIPWLGPLFLPEETGCVACLLDRVKGHRWMEADQLLKSGGESSVRLSVGWTVHSLATVAGLLAVELEKLALGGASEMAGGLFTLDFRMLKLERHPLVKRPQCPLCGTLPAGRIPFHALPKEPLHLQSRVKADYRDGGERVCSAVETLEKYAHLISPVTGIVGGLTLLDEIPTCFGPVIRSDWNVRSRNDALGLERNARLVPTGTSRGKGRTGPQAQASALGEAIERYCSQYEGYETHLRAPLAELGGTAIPPDLLLGFSQRQYRDREAWRKKGSAAYVPDPYEADRPIDWTPAWSLTQRRWRLVPSAFVYYSYPEERGGDICRGCSNGVAAGNCLEEAIMQGFFELVERDAVAMWWYHRLRKPAVDLTRFDSPFALSVNTALDKLGLELEVLDLTHDLGFPVFAANLFNRREDNRFQAMGLGCHRHPDIALERALSELGQCWKMAERDAYSLQFQDTPLSREPFLRADPRQRPRSASDFSRKQRDDFLDDIEEAVELLRARGLEMLVVDLTRPDVGFPVARVIVPGLVHFRPRFGCRRLFEVPGTAGWIDREAGEEDLNPIPFYL